MDIQAELERKAERDQARELEAIQSQADFEAVVSTPSGRRMLRRLLGECGVYRSSFAGEETHAAAYREGHRAIGLYLLGHFEAAPELYCEFLREQPHDD